MMHNRMNEFMKKLLPLIMGCICIMALFQSCELFGLDLQKDFEYEYSPVELTIDMTAYEFIEERKNRDMSLMFEAIQLTGLKSEYEAQERTFIVWNDEAFSSYLADKRYTGLNTVDKGDLKKLLEGNIIRGQYHALDLTSTAVKVETLNPETVLYIGLLTPGLTSQNKYGVRLNDFPNSNRVTNVVTSNIQPTNGIVHVVAAYPEYSLK